MYSVFLVLHSAFRWAVLLGLLMAIGRSYIALKKGKSFTARDNFIRHSTATMAHLQLMFGMVLYTQSPWVKQGLQGIASFKNTETFFFTLMHPFLMLFAIAVITVGSAKAKRKETNALKHRTVLIWFGISLLLILIAIPWPNSPFANRPLIR